MLRSEEEQFGKYRLTRRLAYGGMAEVFLATVHGEAGFSKPVVIKRLHPRLSEDSEFVQMLIDEARITAQLSHGNIGQVLDLGAVDGAYYIAMEFVAGEELRAVHQQFVEDGYDFPVPAALHVLAEVLTGLEYAHNKEGLEGEALHIIHRDVSPQNVMITYEGEVKVIDFGIAKAQSRVVKTQAGVIKGKFRYMSPEQASGEVIDRRTDIFAAGVVLYELLRNEAHLHDVPDTEALRIMREADLEPLDVARPDLPKALMALVHRALTKDRRRRYQTAAEFAAAIRGYMRQANMAFGRAELTQLMRDRFSTKRRQERGGSVPRRAPPTPTREPTEAVVSDHGDDGWRPSQGSAPGGDAWDGRQAYERTGTSHLRVARGQGASGSRPHDAGLRPVDTDQATHRRVTEDRPAEQPRRPSVPQGEHYESETDAAGMGALAQRMRGAPPRSFEHARPEYVPPATQDGGYTDETAIEQDDGRRRPAPRQERSAPVDRRRGSYRGAGAWTRAAEVEPPNAFAPGDKQRWRGAAGDQGRQGTAETDPEEERTSIAAEVGRKMAGSVGRGLGWLITLGAVVAILIGGAYVAKRMGLFDSARDKPQPVVPPDGGPTPLDGLSGDHRASAGGELRVDSRPAGARITVCGEGTDQLTPATVKVPADRSCAVEISLRGYVTYLSDPVAVEAGQRKRIFAVLRRRAGRAPSRRRRAPQPAKQPRSSPDERSSSLDKQWGQLRVTSLEVGTVFVDGRRAGRTPQLTLRLAPGSHTIHLRRQRGERGQTRQAVIRAGQMTSVHFE